MHEPPAIPNSTPVSTPTAAPIAVDSRPLDRRAIFRGVAIGAGVLVMSTMLGIAAVVGMAGERLSPETMIDQLHSRWDLPTLVAASYLLTAALAGYAAAMTAGRGPLRHATCAGAATLGVNLIVIAVCGSLLPLWLLARACASPRRVPCWADISQRR